MFRSAVWAWALVTCVLLIVLGLYRPDKLDEALVFIVTWFQVVLVIVALIGGIGGAAIFYVAVQERRLRGLRPEDGAFPLREYRVGGWRSGQRLLVNPTNMASHATMIDTRTGQVYDVEPSMGWEQYSVIRKLIEQANAIRAMFPGDKARRDPHGSMSKMPSAAGAARMLKESKSPGAPSSAVVDVTAEEVRMCSLQAAYAAATVDSWVLGQRVGTKRLLRAESATLSHTAILGASGTGKSSGAAMLFVLQALRSGWWVVVLDAKAGADWSEFRDRVEFHASHSGNFPTQVAGVHAEFERRSALIAAAGVPHIDQIADPPPRLLCAIEEYGDLNDSMDKAEAKVVNAQLVQILRRGRAAGVIVVFIDQYPGEWDRQVLNNTTTKIVYWLQHGGVVQEHGVHKLKKPGEFMLDGNRYAGWDTRPHVRQLLASVPVSAPHTPVVASIADVVDVAGADGVRAPVREPVRPEVEGGAVSSTNGTNGGSTWADFVDGWMGANPEHTTGEPSGLRKLMRAMSVEEHGHKGEENRYSGEAHKHYHAWRREHPDGADLGRDWMPEEGAVIDAESVEGAAIRAMLQDGKDIEVEGRKL